MIAALLRILFYLALGPLLLAFAGNIAIALALAIGWATAEPGTGPLDVFTGFLSSENLTQAYIIGTLPMLLVGIVALILSFALSGWRHWLAVAFGGATISAAFAWFVFISAPISEGADVFLLAAVSAFAGGAAGFLCALLFDLIAGQVRRTA